MCLCDQLLAILEKLLLQNLCVKEAHIEQYEMHFSEVGLHDLYPGTCMSERKSIESMYSLCLRSGWKVLEFSQM